MRTDDPSSIELQERVKTLEKRMDSKSPPHLYLHDVYTHTYVLLYIYVCVLHLHTLNCNSSAHDIAKKRLAVKCWLL